ncbi:DUF5011 domain-containing protein, partial [Erysipelotrichaceae bacterium OttesenSCG-928-M19]|nr:DUF5011 domain-containing protein [Erysipelotrichaceae bacterium OttesenSCG-928-M19]
MSRLKKTLLVIMLAFFALVGTSSTPQKIDATTDYFGEIEDAWMLGAYTDQGSIIKMSDGTLYASGSNSNGKLGLGSGTGTRQKFEKVIFHNVFYGTGKEIIQVSYVNVSRGLLLDDQGNVYYSSTLAGAHGYGDTNIFANASLGATFDSSIDENRATTTTLSGNDRYNTGGEFVIHQGLADWSEKTGKKIVKIAGTQSAIIFETDDGSLWGIGGGGQANDFVNNILGLGTTVSTDDGNGNYVKHISENVEDWSAELANNYGLTTHLNTLFFKTNGEWYALGAATFGKTMTGITAEYLTTTHYNNPNTVDGQPGIGRKVDVGLINNAHGTSYTSANIKQVQPNLGRTEFLMDDGKLYTVGETIFGSVPTANGLAAASSAIPILNLIKASDTYKASAEPGWDYIEEIYPSHESTWVRMSNGHIWARGSNDAGDLGFNATSPALIEFLLTDITDPGNTGRMGTIGTANGNIQKSPLTTVNPMKMAISYDGSMMLNSEGYIMGTGPTGRGFYGGTNQETNYNGWGFTRIKRDYRVVRNPEIVVNGDNNAINWIVNPESIKIGKSTEYADKDAGTYPTFAEFTIYGCGSDYTTKSENTCTYTVSGASNKVAGTTWTSAHDANKIDDNDLYDVDLNSLNLEPGYYKIVAKRYAFIGPNGTGLSGVNKGTLQYNETGTDDEYYVEFKIDPVITADDYIEVEKDSTFDATANATGKNSKGKDVPFGDGEFDLQYTSNVDTSAVGVYEVTYTMDDEFDEGVTTTKTVKVLVKDEDTVIDYDKGYMIDAKDYTLNKETDAVLGTEAELIDKSAASGWVLETGATTTIKVIDNGGYKDEIGGYKAIFGISAEESVKTTIIASIIGPNTVVKDGYAIDAESFVILSKDFGGNADFTNATYGAAKAWNMTNPEEEVSVSIVNDGGYSAADGRYTVTLAPDKKLSTSKSIQARVIDKDKVVVGEEYFISANDVILSKDQAKAITNFDELITYAKAEAEKIETGTKGTVKVDGANTNFKSDAGTYNARFYVNEEVATYIDVEIKVLPYDVITIGDNYIIGANHFSVKRSEVAGLTNAKILELSGATAWLKSDENTKGTVNLVNHNIIAENGTYDVNMNVVQEPATATTVVATVAGGNPPTITATSPLVVTINTVPDLSQGVVIADTEDTDINFEDNVEVTGAYDMSKAGVYTLTYTVTDSDSNSATASRVLVVDDGSFVIGENYMIQAYSYVINMPDVVVNDAAILLETKAVAYKKADGTKATATILDNGGYAKAKGTYIVRVGVAEETATFKDVSAVVLDKDAIIKGEQYSIGAKSIVTGKDNVRNISDADLIKLIDAEAWKNTDYNDKGTVLVEDRATLKAEAGS